MNINVFNKTKQKNTYQKKKKKKHAAMLLEARKEAVILEMDFTGKLFFP